MRRLNMILASCMILVFAAHAVAGAFQLFGAPSGALKHLARLLFVLIAAHAAISLALTVKTLIARKRAGAGYFKDNLLFWARRVSGFALIPPLAAHLAIFIATSNDTARLQAFTSGRMISQILFVLALALHILTNVRPVLISLGVKKGKETFAAVILVLGSLLLLFSIAFLVYYLRKLAL